MSTIKKIVSILLMALFSTSLFAKGIPILCYHNFNPTKPGSMNMTPAEFESQIKWLKENGFTIISLEDAVKSFQNKDIKLPKKPVVISADDGWESVYRYMYPIVKKYQFPVTLFIYPETISRGKNTMTWEQLKELQKTGLFDVQSHTYSHPNFKHARKAMSAEGYGKFVTKELLESKQILEKNMNKKISYLAWPFGIYDSYLEQQAANAGYAMAFTIDALKANDSFRAMAQPRYMIVVPLSVKSFSGKVN